MAKFNVYSVRVEGDDGEVILDGKQVFALSHESAWHKAVEEAFDACAPGTGSRPNVIHVSRLHRASDYHE